MNPVVFHIVSGQSFFTGLMLLIVAALLSGNMRPRFRRAAPVLTMIGVIAIALSSTPIPYWAYGLLAAVLLGWTIASWLDKRRKAAAIALAAACLLCGGLELPFHILPTLIPVNQQSIVIIGDSVTAGLGENSEETWPRILSRTHGIRVDDISHVGETAASALQRARRNTIDAPIVFIEIGGNDVLGTTTAPQFERDLDALLAFVAAPQRQVVMLELPLPPFFHAYGRAQRASAKRQHVALVPKRVFLGVLATNSATLDSIHLSQAGHTQMAETAWEIVEPAYVAR